MPQPNKHNPEWTDDELKLIAVAVRLFVEGTMQHVGGLTSGEKLKVARVATSIQHKCEIFKPEHNPEIVLPSGFSL